VLLGRAWAIVGYGWLVLPVTLAFSFCGIGLPFAARALKMLAHECLRSACRIEGRASPADAEQRFSGLISLVGVTSACIGVLLVTAQAIPLCGGLPHGLALVLVLGLGSCVLIGAALNVVLLSRFEGASATGLRESAAVFPDDGRLTLGAKEDAGAVLIRGAVRRASLVALPVLLGIGAAVGSLLVSL